MTTATDAVVSMNRLGRKLNNAQAHFEKMSKAYDHKQATEQLNALKMALDAAIELVTELDSSTTASRAPEPPEDPDIVETVGPA